VYESGMWPVVLAVWSFFTDSGPGLIVLTLAGTGGCWIGIRAADRFNEQFREKRGVYPIDYIRSRLGGGKPR
jgi:hypothetical protein